MVPLSKRGRLAAVVVVGLTIAAEIAAWVVYRNSTDGQTPLLWGGIVLYGVIAVGVVRTADGWFQRRRGAGR